MSTPRRSGAHELDAAARRRRRHPHGRAAGGARSSTTSRRRRVACRPSSRVGVPVRPVSLPSSWLASRSWSLVPVAGEVDDDWVEVIGPDAHRRGRLAGHASPARCRRPCRAGGAEPIGPILRRADLVGLSHLDVARRHVARRPLRGSSIPARACWSPRVATVACSSRPVTTVRSRCSAICRRRPSARSTRPGQATRSSPRCSPCSCGRASPLRRADRSPRALRFAAAAGSLAVEDVGLAGVPDRTSVMVRRARERVRRAVPDPDRAGRRGGPAPVVAFSRALVPSSRGRGGRPAAAPTMARRRSHR